MLAYGEFTVHSCRISDEKPKRVNHAIVFEAFHANKKLISFEILSLCAFVTLCLCAYLRSCHKRISPRMSVVRSQLLRVIGRSARSGKNPILCNGQRTTIFNFPYNFSHFSSLITYNFLRASRVLVLHGGLSAQFDSTAIINSYAFDRHLVADFTDLVNIFNMAVCQFADMHQAIFSG